MLTEKNSLENLKIIDLSNYITIPKKKEYVLLNNKEFGTLDYCSPEIDNLHFYKNDDVWSVGIMAHLLLSCKFIYTKSQIEINKMIYNLQVSDLCKDLLLSMLVIDPLKRFSIKKCLDHKIFDSMKK